MGDGVKGNMDTTGANLPAAAESVELFAEENGVFHEVYTLPAEGGRGVSGGGGSWEEGEENRRERWKSGSEGRKGAKEERGAVLVRTRNGRVGGRASGEGAAAELLGELFGMFKGEEMRKKRG